MAHKKQKEQPTSESGNAAKLPVSRSMSYQKLAVIIETNEGKYFQVALNQEMCDCLFTDLKNYFSDNVVKILPNELSGFTLEVAINNKPPQGAKLKKMIQAKNLLIHLKHL